MPIVPSSLTCGVIPKTPIGSLTLIFSTRGLIRIEFGSAPEHEPSGAPFERAAEELEAYFSGTLTSFSIELDAHGTRFQRRVWALLQTIPYGETRSYGHLARVLGDANLARAVGHANGSNPIPILYPCHRVVGSNRHLTGYRGGLHRKDILLQLEARHTRPELFRHPVNVIEKP